MNRNTQVDPDMRQFQAHDREALEAGSKVCWNRFTRFLDKFVEVVFIGTLSLLAVWNFLM